MSKLFWGAAASMVAGAVLSFVTVSYAMHQPTEFLHRSSQILAQASGFSLATQLAQAVMPGKAPEPVATTTAEATPAPGPVINRFGGAGVFEQAREMIREEEDWKDSEKQLLEEKPPVPPVIALWKGADAGEEAEPAPINGPSTEPAAECPNKDCCKNKKCCGEKGCAADKSCCEKSGCCKDQAMCPEHLDCCPMFTMVEAVLQCASNAMTHALMVPVTPVAQEPKDTEDGIEESEPTKPGQAPDCNEDMNYEHRYPGCPYLSGDPKYHNDKPVTVPQTSMLPKTKLDENVGDVEEAEQPTQRKPSLDTMEFRQDEDAKRGEFDKKPM